ncbi:hypothetical protein EYF80_062520 [Liparis tanakae]|uniref:Uncharacterized protein n=1 Tax=Liparis tanakae TaxID=230148 RepID=A0A4Z2EEN5_9TELE|nr:hypothetical protein EYF80_062520 [Liparis tanakae]
MRPELRDRTPVPHPRWWTH